MANNHIKPITNALTIDVEDYFQVYALSDVIKYDDWDHIPSHVEKNTYKILDILDSQQSAVSGQPQPTQLTHSAAGGLDFLPFIPLGRRPVRAGGRIGRNKKKSSKSSESCLTTTSPKATFFILGWIAKRYAHLVKEIHSRGHEIASHGYAHKVIYNQTPAEFREDIKSSKAILEELTGNEVLGYRAPTYSITKKTLWALKILAEEGYKKFCRQLKRSLWFGPKASGSELIGQQLLLFLDYNRISLTIQ